MSRLAFVAGIWLAVYALAAAWGATWYVDARVSSSGDGKIWASAFKTIQQGVDAAGEGDEVSVADGIYFENVQFRGRNIILRSRDPLNGAVVQNTVIDGSQLVSVVTFSGTEDDTCVLAGFTLRSGKGQFDGKYGGGIYGGWTRATIRNNIIVGNRTPST